MLNTPFSPWPSYSPEEIDIVASVLRSNKVNYWTGQECRDFELEFSQFSGSKHSIAVGNGTLAIDLALRAIGVGSGDEVVVTPRSFIASVSTVALLGATPVFADVDLSTQAISATTIGAVITEKTKAIIVVHLGGMPAGMDEIMKLAASKNIMVIEDCAQAHGTRYQGKSAGSIGHIGTWSFCQDKIMSTGGEGGMVTTNDDSLWEKMWSFKDHGKSWNSVNNKVHPPGFRWLHDGLGSNYRLTEMQSAIGRYQLRQLPDWIKARSKNAEALSQVAFESGLVDVQNPGAENTHAWYKWNSVIKPEKLASGWTRDKIVDAIVAKGVPCYQGSCSEIYLEKAFDGSGYRPLQPLKNARYLGENNIMMLVHPTLTDAEIQKSCEVLGDVLKAAS